MSIANVVIEHDRALIGVDTLAGYMAGVKHVMSDDERRDRHSCKLALFPQISMAMTQRGDAFLVAIARLALDVECPRSFDHAAQLMPAILPAAYMQAMATRKQQFGIESFHGADVVLVGWSPSRLRFDSARWIRRPEDSVFTETRGDKALFLPEIDRIEPVEPPDTADKMETLMRRQVDWASREHPQFPCGGKLLMAELTRNAVNVRTIADLG